MVLPGCSQPTSLVTYPAYNQVYGIATHNSYWINRSDQADFFSSGTQELLTDQLLHDHVRALELDAHSEELVPGLTLDFRSTPPGTWRIFHTSSAEDTSCRFLTDCLEMLRTFQYAVPQHDVVNIVVELKDVSDSVGAISVSNIDSTRPVFDGTHTIDQFDATFRTLLGNSALYTPADFLARCPNATTLTACARTKGWPTIDQLRGKFIINVLGNWSTAAADWVDYASGDIRQRVAFPMQTIFGLSPYPVPTGQPYGPYCNETIGGLGAHGFTDFIATAWDGSGAQYCIRDIDDTAGGAPNLDATRQQQAFAQSVFWQLEDLGPIAAPIVKTFLDANHNVVMRAKDSFNWNVNCAAHDGSPCPNDAPSDSAATNTNGQLLGCAGPEGCQDQRIQLGFQLIQTDYPWHFVRNSAMANLGIPTDPSQRLYDPSWIASTPKLGTAPFVEPGDRLYFHVPWPPDVVYGSTVTEPELFQSMTVPATGTRWWESMVSTTRNGETWGEVTYRPGGGVVVQDVDPTFGHHSDCSRYVVGYIGDQTLQPTDGDCHPYSYPRAAQGNGGGCIEASSSSGQNWVALCRQKNYGGKPPAFDPSYFQEAVRVFVFENKDGQMVQTPVNPDPGKQQFFAASRYTPCPTSDLPNSDDTYAYPQCVGSLIAMSITNLGAAGSDVRLYSAGRLLPPPSLTPDWNLLATVHFDEPMTLQGLTANQDVLFVGTRTSTVFSQNANPQLGPLPQPGSLVAVRAKDLPNRYLNVPDSGTAKMVDLSS